MRSELNQLPEREKRDKVSDSAIAFFEKLDISKIFAEETTRREFLKVIDFDTFMALLVRINGFIRNIPIKKREIDGEFVYIELDDAGEEIYNPPQEEDKLVLLEEAFEASKKLENISDAALLVSTVLNAVHPFHDGNGRTSRLVYFLLKNGCQGTQTDKDELKRILSEKSGPIGSPNPGNIEKFLVGEIRKEKNITLPLENAGFTIDQLRNRGSLPENHRYRLLTMHEFYHDQRGLIVLADFLQTKGIVEPSVNHPQVLIPSIAKYFREIESNLPEEELEKLRSDYRELKKEYIRKVIDVFVSPENHIIPSTNIRVRDYYLQMVEEGQVVINHNQLIFQDGTKN